MWHEISREKHFGGLQNETGNALYIYFSKFLSFAPRIQDKIQGRNQRNAWPN